ncbi:MAG: DUF1570 domain-containing protein, partial [Polyangiaceae bacterium]
MRIWLPLFAISAVACTPSGAWRRVETPHFVVNTNLASRDAKHAGAALESTRDALISAAFSDHVFANQKTQVYVVARGMDFERYFGKKTGLFVAAPTPTFFLHGKAESWEVRRGAPSDERSVLRHEMAHQLANEAWPRQARWFSEGLANFLEPLYYASDGRHVVLGSANLAALRQYKSVRATTLFETLAVEAMAAKPETRTSAGLSGHSWLFVHWLRQTHTKQFVRYTNALPRLAPADAWKLAFPELDATTIDRELRAYEKAGNFVTATLPLAAT